MVDLPLAALVFLGRTRARDGAQLRVPGNPLSDNELITLLERIYCGGPVRAPKL
jgi:hypothetical protein